MLQLRRRRSKRRWTLRCRTLRKDLAYVTVADVFGIEREQSLLDRALRHDGAADRGLAGGRIVERLRRAAGEDECDGGDERGERAMNRIHESPSMR